jgi:hypothetical protein
MTKFKTYQKGRRESACLQPIFHSDLNGFTPKRAKSQMTTWAAIANLNAQKTSKFATVKKQGLHLHFFDEKGRPL